MSYSQITWVIKRIALKMIQGEKKELKMWNAMKDTHNWENMAVK